MFRPGKLVLIAAPYQFVSNTKNPLGMKRDLYDKFRSNVAKHYERALHKAWELILSGDSRAGEVREYLDKQDKKKTLETDWLHLLDMLDGFSFDGTNFSDFPPTLLIHGGNDVVVAPEQSQQFSSVIPYSKLIMISGAGHAPHWHDAGRVQEAIMEHVHV